MRGERIRSGGLREGRVRRWLVLVLLGALLATSPGGVAADSPAGGIAAGTRVAQSGYTPSFEVAGAVARPRSYTLADLQRLPAIDVIHHCVVGDTHALRAYAYRGVLLWSLLADAGIALPPGPAPASLRSYVVAAGSDDYDVLIALAELDSEFNRRDVIVAYARDGELLDETHGMAQMIVPSDLTCERDVYHLARLEVRELNSPLRGGR
jgi:DMSO/TMAO reductase YedYZ molybdopterin-dependent catalytic subunit